MKRLMTTLAVVAMIAIGANAQQQVKYSASVNGVTFYMLPVEGGTFNMGHDVTSDMFYHNDSPAHEVAVESFLIGETEVTQALWKAVMGENPSRFTESDDNPVEGVNWGQCQRFISRLNELTNLNFRLPTEAEWEFAARGGNLSKGTLYAGSDDYEDVAWIGENDGKQTHPVRGKKPNELGLYDMTGNVWEWTSSGFSKYGTEPKLQPTDGGYLFVYRGGGYISSDRQSSVYHRSYGQLTDSNHYIGLRLALSMPQKQEEGQSQNQ